MNVTLPFGSPPYKCLGFIFLHCIIPCQPLSFITSKFRVSSIISYFFLCFHYSHFPSLFRLPSTFHIWLPHFSSLCPPCHPPVPPAFCISPSPPSPNFPSFPTFFSPTLPSLLVISCYLSHPSCPTHPLDFPQLHFVSVSFYFKS